MSIEKSQGVVVVTGGAGEGVGFGISRAVAEYGWTVLIVDRDAVAAENAVAALRAEGLDAVSHAIDIADPASVEALFATIVPQHGPLRGLVHSAGVGLVKRLADVTLAEWDAVMQIDLRAAFLCAKAAIPLLAHNGGGAIVNIGSVQSLGPHIGYSTYAAAKAGLVGLTRGIAADYGSSHIRCSIIHPGLVDSPQTRATVSAWGDGESWIDNYVHTRQMIPRIIGSAEIGAAAVFLLSDAGRSITAAEITIDAGSSRMAWDTTGDRL